MFGRFEIWVLPHNLRAASLKAAEFLKNADFDFLYLNLQHEFDCLIKDLALGAPYEEFMDHVKRAKLICEPISSWEYWIEPVLLATRGLKLKRPGLRIHCYKSPIFEEISVKNAEKIALLTFRVNVIEKVDAEKWRKILYDLIDESSKSLDYEVKYILKTLDMNGEGLRAVCLSDFSGRHIMRALKNSGVDAGLRYVFSPYYFTPIEILVREAAGELRGDAELSDGRILDLVKLHAEFIREYVLTSINYDEAYFKWVLNKIYKKI